MYKFINKKIFCFSIIFNILFCFFSPFFSMPTVKATDSIINKLYDYVISSLGFYERKGGKITPVSKDSEKGGVLYARILEAWDNGGIYIDNNGNYIFTEDVNKQLIDSIKNDSSVDYFICYDFSSFLDGSTDSFYSMDDLDFIHYFMRETNKLIVKGYMFGSSNSRISTGIYVFDIRNVAYIVIGRYDKAKKNNYSSQYSTIQFFDKSGNRLKVPFGYIVHNNDFSVTYKKGFTFDSSCTSEYVPFLGAIWDDDLNDFIDPWAGSFYHTSQDFSYSSFPGINVFSTTALIVSTNTNSGMQGLKNRSQYIYINKSLSNINENIFNETNWNDIYNDNLTIINNNITQDTSDPALYDLLKNRIDLLDDSINNGISDLNDYISYSNNLLQEIINILNDIDDNLSDLSDKVDSSCSSDIDLSDLYTRLDEIKLYLSSSISSASTSLSNNISSALAVSSDSIASAVSDSIETESDKIQGKIDCSNELLQYVLDELVKLNKKDFGGGGSFSPIVPIFDIDIDPTLDVGFDVDADVDVNVDFKNIFKRATDNLPFLDQVHANSRLIARAMCDVAPLCYIAYIGTIINALATEPEPPDFSFNIKTTPFASLGDSGGSLTSFTVDEDIDLSFGVKFETAHKYLEAFLTIIFVLILVLATFKLMPLILSLLGIFIPNKGGSS